MKPVISIIIPSLNKVRFIGQTLDSIFDQAYPNLEVIIQDGRSTDCTVEVIKKFAQEYPAQIRWESKKDNGQLDAINMGLNKATGDILTFINADDVYTKGALLSVEEAYLKNPGALWFAGRGRVINAAGKEITKLITLYKNLLLFLNSRFYLLTTNYLMQPSVFVSRKAYQKYGPFTGSNEYILEYDLWLRLSEVEMPVVINKYLSKFRIESSTKTKQMSKAILDEDLGIVRRHTDNRIAIFLHRINNFARLVVNKFV